MASPPNYGGATSPPPGSTGLALPRQRPGLALPGQVPSRKPSIASAGVGTPTAHPLRQTSFPPSDTLEAQHALAEDSLLRRSQYSPSAASADGGGEGGEGLEGFSDEDNDISSAISGPAGEASAVSFGGGGAGKKRKRGADGKKKTGRPPKNSTRAGSASLVNGEEGSGPTRGNKENEADAEDEDEDDDEDPNGRGGRAPLYEGGQMSNDQLQEERERKRLFYEGITEEQQQRLAAFQRSKLRPADVRKLVNQVLGQSVPQNVVLVVGAYAKMFAGMLIEDARGVQGEWEACREKKADGSENPAYKKLKRSKEGKKADVGGEVKKESAAKADENHDGTNGTQTTATKSASAETNDTIKAEATSPTKLQDVPPASNSTSPKKKDASTNDGDDDSEDDDIPSGGAAGLARLIEEPDRGPLLPDHLREALRRYKKRRSGAVGFTGLSLEGRENTASKVGGRRLFR